MRYSLRKFLPAAAVCLFAFAVSSSALPGAFILDDVEIVRDNPLLREADLKAIFGADYWGPESNSNLYRPVTILSLALNRTLFGAEPFSFHVVNILLHMLASLLLYLLLLGLPMAAGVAWLAASLFAVHPIHGEAVNIVVGRSELLAAVFTLLGLLAALRKGRGHLPMTALLYALALLAKESSGAFILLLLCIDLFTTTSPGRLWRERRRLYSLLFFVTLAWMALRTWALSQAILPAQIISPVDNPLVGLPIVPRLLTVVWIQLFYLRNLLVPFPLLGVYTADSIVRVESLLSPAAGGALAVAAVAVIAGVHGWRGRRVFALGMALYLAAFLVNLNIFFLTFIAVADRFAYLPSAGFCLAVSALLLAPSGRDRSRALRLTTRAMAAVYLILLAGLALPWNATFSSPLRLWQHTVRVNPGGPRGWLFLAGEYALAGRAQEAEDAYLRSIAADPTFPDPHFHFSVFLYDAGRAEETLLHAEESIRLEPESFGPVFLQAARANLRLGRPREALRRLDEVHRYYAQDPFYQEIRGKTLDSLGDAAGAIALYRRIAPLGEISPAVTLRLAELLLGRNEAHEAEAVLRVRAAAAGSADLHNLLGVALALQGRFSEAVPEFERSLELEPGSTLFRDNLERAREQAGGALQNAGTGEPVRVGR